MGESEMCDYSLHSIRSRPAKVGDKLTTRDFGTGTRGFAASEARHSQVAPTDGHFMNGGAGRCNSDADERRGLSAVRYRDKRPSPSSI